MSQSADTWVSQADAVALLGTVGDKISQQALSAYLKGHPEVAQRQEGRRIWVHWPSLKQSRATRAARGPASQPPLFDEARQLEVIVEPATPEPTVPASPPRQLNIFGDRKAQADTERAEADARRARVLADEAEARVFNRDTAINAFTTAGIALVRALEEGRMTLVQDVRAADDVRTALLVVQKHEKAVRAAFANALTEFAAAEEPSLAAAE